MKLPGFKRIYTPDYPKDSQPTIDRLADVLNIGIETLYTLANNRISLKDNCACVVKNILVTVNSQGNPIGATAITLDNIIQTPIGAEVLRVQNQTNPSIYPTGAPFISFTQNNNTIVVDNITGLQAGNQWLLTVVVYGA